MRTALHRHRLAVLIAASSIALSGCGPKKPAAVAAAKPSTAEAVGHESELLKLTLTPQAETRLGLATVAVGSGVARPVRSVHGEIVAAPFAGGIPASSTTDLAALAANQARADGDVARLRAELQVAQRAYTRAEALVREEAGSVRGRDETESALGVVRANLATAQAQRNLLGPRVGALAQAGPVWVRVAVFASDLDSIDRAAPAAVKSLGGDRVVWTARPAAGPPSANVGAGTVDLYYALAGGGPLRIGQRVAVDLPMRGQSRGLMVPASALLRDIYGGEWIYVRTAPHAYERRRIEVASLQNGQALVARGLGSGAEVVTAGAMELFGAEFGAK